MLTDLRAVAIVVCICLIRDNNATCQLKTCMTCTHGQCTECVYGWFGADCSQRCERCDSGGCEQLTGRCFHCLPGHYRDACDIPCPDNCTESYDDAMFCDRITGECSEGCKKSFWGLHCNYTCSEHCLQYACQQEDGTCPFGCMVGFYGKKCTLICPEHCLNKCSSIHGYCDECKPGFRGQKCNISCPNCIDENCTYNELDELLICTNGCKDGYTSANCSVRCSERCRDQLCERDGRCTDCPDGYYGDMCTHSIKITFTVTTPKTSAVVYGIEQYSAAGLTVGPTDLHLTICAVFLVGLHKTFI